jgi:hypothetical protein
MRMAIGTNVLLALWSEEPSEGGLVISAPAYAELLAYPKIRESFVNSFLQDTSIKIDFDFQQPWWLEAGRKIGESAGRSSAPVL